MSSTLNSINFPCQSYSSPKNFHPVPSYRDLPSLYALLTENFPSFSQFHASVSSIGAVGSRISYISSASNLSANSKTTRSKINHEGTCSQVLQHLLMHLSLARRCAATLAIRRAQQFLQIPSCLSKCLVSSMIRPCVDRSCSSDFSQDAKTQLPLSERGHLEFKNNEGGI